MEITNTVKQYRSAVMKAYGLSYDNAVQYVMERLYNGMSHTQAMLEIDKQKREKHEINH